MNPRIHPRELPVIEAENDLREHVVQWLEAHPELTSWETLRALQSVFSAQATGLIWVEIRVERYDEGRQL